MFDKPPLFHILPTANIWKGGDFMGVEQDHPAILHALDAILRYHEQISKMEWEGDPLPGEGRVVTENPCFPERNGRGRKSTVPETTANADPLLRQP